MVVAVRLLSTRELADALGVSESSLKRWVDAGRIAASRTEGGHRRIPLPEALRFIRDTRQPIAHPELLDLPEVAVARARGERLGTYLREGDAVGARGWLVARYLEGATIAELADGPIRDAMHALGELWHHELAGVFVEHRGTDACLQAVAQLRSMMRPPPEDAPIALGGAPSADPYLVASQLAAMTIAEAEMTSINLGPDTPVTALEAAVARHHPKLVWVSISSKLSPTRARELADGLATLPKRIAVVVGGQQAHTLEIPERVRRLSSMADLAAVAGDIVARQRA